MTGLLYLAAGIAGVPFLLGLWLLRRQMSPALLTPSIASVLLSALAFNLTFIWQELWLVIPKALTPGLHPILFHNNHTWTGQNPLAELLQGTGAAATFVSGMLFAGALAYARSVSATWRLFFYWMAFQGLYQFLVQIMIGTVLPGNDVGRALSYLALGGNAKLFLLMSAILGMALAGLWLAPRFPEGRDQTSIAIGSAIFSAIVSVLLIVPFRLPRSPIEVVVVPLIINWIGSGWIALGAGLTRAKKDSIASAAAGLWGPALALCVTLLVFQTVLRVGIRF
jgi:hypothetical protein